MLEKIEIVNFKLEDGTVKPKISLFYQTFGKAVGDAPVVVVNHALTGNSNVSGDAGWWRELVGKGKAIDTQLFTVIVFNIPGNGYDKEVENQIADYKRFTVKDVARLFWCGLFSLRITHVFAIIGGSLGGGVAWQMAALQPKKIRNLVPIATHYKASNWVIANVYIQNQILNNSLKPIEDARQHAMLLYRTPQSINEKFNCLNSHRSTAYTVENWLSHHGKSLQERFSLAAYKMMNHLLKTIDITENTTEIEQIISSISGSIHLVAIDTDLLFTSQDNKETYQKCKHLKSNLFYHEILSMHGHDAFLIEYQQLTTIFQPIFQNTNHYVNI